ncbi:MULTISPECIES: signal peptide peptidase SppA [Photorhabdus]|uniref:Signal peptide peptidase SppA n=2 Tax=Photorhabdus TaxID=29487 RepID=A0ABX0B202_9GAMM|nr:MULTISPECIES: signal peptide peptidase SppA [Photorhabdus]MCC8375002.1 signal peptide peptidase SppA [Photorhabdus bodei]MCC8464976.1 signal peptide peptidase SppA [Photorhabdus bodei]MCT8353713.1 signal peptide peptidase SppA [Photorhabdus kayaii]MDB6371343.1 signal peptide peptidase SppA [Photorhabdus bodei]NDL11148.1 signal peptide peptidase SppA [Photorhabdus kayaii]
MRILWKLIARLFKWSWRLLNFIREVISNLIFIMLILIVVGGFLIYQQTNKTADSYQGALYVNLTGIIVDQVSSRTPLTQLGRELFGTSSNKFQENSLFDIVDSIRQAKTDNKITGLVLKLDDFIGTDQPSMQYIGKAINEFKASGKPVYAISDSYNQSQYYLATFADKIYLSPQGTVGLYGYSTNNLYYKSLLDSLKVTAHIFRVGTYKSAVEPIMRDDMSPAAREADNRWVNGLWHNYLNTVATNRKLSVHQVFPGADEMIANLRAVGGDNAQYALKYKLVDYVAPRNVIENDLIKAFGWDEKNRHFNAISIYDYAPQLIEGRLSSKGNIAVIVAQGAIIDGQQTQGMVGGDTTAAQIRQARLDDNIKAVILRVNSPGGSVSASDVIRTELAALRATNKPVVVSMGGMAASGGYWIATPANYIIANQSTLTGSIGIFGVITTYENSLEHIGIHTDGVSTTPLAGISVTKGLSKEFSALMQLNIENGYNNFIGLVATSRHKTREEIDKIAQGHVWTGNDAKTNGLVDQLGDFDDAVTKAAELAKLDNPDLDWMQPEMSFSELLMNQLTTTAQAIVPEAVQAWLPAPLVQVAQEVKQQSEFYRHLNDPQNRYAFCLNCGDVR